MILIFYTQAVICERDLVKEERRKPKGSVAQLSYKRKREETQQQQFCGVEKQVYWVEQGPPYHPAVTAWLETANRLVSQGLLEQAPIGKGFPPQNMAVDDNAAIADNLSNSRPGTRQSLSLIL